MFLSISACGDVKKEQVGDTIENKRPNVILVMTDDQGIGDLGAHGNPWLKTPNIDQFYKESVRLIDFHVSPMCTPTRAALMTGLYPINNGVWATYKGRDLLHPDMVTMPEVFRDNGYATGIFGKWHLGDNYPSRPTDRGFEFAVHHASGGVGELSDYWGNNYFDDTYLVNNEPQEFEGYCTDVWLDEAIKFIKAKKEEPFFVYIPTNAPHTPLYVDDKYVKPYKSLEGTKIPEAKFYGMLANIDENFGRLEAALSELRLAENTIVVFCTDNGSASGVSKDYKLGWNKGFRGKKGEKLEGGHRVPFFIRWPKAKIQGGKDLNDLTAHVDILTTLAGLCNLELPEDFKGDGIDFSSRLLGRSEPEDRTVFVHHRQDFLPPEPINNTALLKGDWRLLDGDKLYDIVKDRKQLNNLAQDYPEVVTDLLKENETFTKQSATRKEYQEFAHFQIGTDYQQKTKLTIQHAIGDDGPIWKQEEIAAGIKNTNASQPIEIVEKGTYRFSLMRWPEECNVTIHGVPDVNPKGGIYTYEKVYPDRARVTVFGKTLEKEIFPEDKKVIFEIALEPGKSMLRTHFIEDGEEYGVYYTYVELVEI